MDTNELLKHKLKLKFGLAPYEPNDEQLVQIQRHIKRIKDNGEHPTHSDWEHAVRQHCQSIGACSYSGVDNSDLNYLLTIATAKTGSRS